MSNFLARHFDALACHFWRWRWRISDGVQRFARAWRYFTGRLTADDAQWIMFECERSAGCHPLLTLSVDDVLPEARETFADHPELPRLVADACARVADKWESYNDELYEARRRAIELVEEYATNEGITLVRLAESDDLPRVNDAGGIGEGGKP